VWGLATGLKKDTVAQQSFNTSAKKKKKNAARAHKGCRANGKKKYCSKLYSFELLVMIN
jgi:hypothetical protein